MGTARFVDKRPLKTDFRGECANERTDSRVLQRDRIGKGEGCLLCNWRGPERQGLEEKKREEIKKGDLRAQKA